MSTARKALFDSLEAFQERGTGLFFDHAFLLSAAVRAFGLHDALSREIEHANPHAVLPLLRSMLDLVLVVLQVRRDPEYAKVVMDVTGPGRLARHPLSSQRLLANARHELPGMKDVWDELSDATHFGRAGFVHTIGEVRSDESGIHVSVSTEPRWRDHEDKLVALASLAVMTQITAKAFRKILTDRPPGSPL